MFFYDIKDSVRIDHAFFPKTENTVCTIYSPSIQFSHKFKSVTSSIVLIQVNPLDRLENNTNSFVKFPLHMLE